MNERVERRLREAEKEHGGLVWGIDALEPEGHGTLLYVLYKVSSGTPVAAAQLDHPTADELVEWLQPYRELPFTVLATLSDGEKAIIAALKTCWSKAPHQRCQEHILGNLAEAVLEEDTKLRKRMKDDLGHLAAVPTEPDVTVASDGQTMPAPPFCLPRLTSEIES